MTEDGLYDLDEYVRETRAFMIASVPEEHHPRVELATGQLRRILLMFGGMPKPAKQVIDTDTLKISLTWEASNRTTTIEVDDTPGFHLQWTLDGTSQRLSTVITADTDPA